MNLILCGMMGAGKTTVAKALAKLTGYQSYDTDAEIVKKHGNISDIFARFGEEYFRDLETQTVKELVNEQNAIISVGGGLVLRQENVEILKKTGKIVYLRASLDTLTKRLQGDTARPLLQDEKESLQSKLTRLLNARGDIYEKAADLVLDVDDKTPQEIARQLLEKLG
jgi:shikimate kinase